MTGVRITGQNYDEHTFTITPSSGTVSHTTTLSFNNQMAHLIIEPTSSTTSYKFNITQEDGTKIYDKTMAQTGRLGVLGIGLPLVGKLTFQITNASVDEEFKIKIVYQ